MEEGREKCEMFLNYYFVCFRTFVLDPNSHNFLNPMSIYTLVFPGGIISVSVYFCLAGSFQLSCIACYTYRYLLYYDSIISDQYRIVEM